jgi:uncharacterized protein (TIGR02246 family)
MSIEDEIRKVTVERSDALKAADAGKFADLLTEETKYVSAFGSIWGKAETLAELRSGNIKVSSYELDQFQVKVYGDGAVATYRTTMSAWYKGMPRAGEYRGTSVYVKRGGRWLLAAHQMTPLAAQANAQPAPFARPAQAPQVNFHQSKPAQIDPRTAPKFLPPSDHR